MCYPGKRLRFEWKSILRRLQEECLREGGSKLGEDSKLKSGRLKASNFWSPLDIHLQDSLERPYGMFPVIIYWVRKLVYLSMNSTVIGWGLLSESSIPYHLWCKRLGRQAGICSRKQLTEVECWGEVPALLYPAIARVSSISTSTPRFHPISDT